MMLRFLVETTKQSYFTGLEGMASTSDGVLRRDSDSVTPRLCRVAGQPGEHVSIFRCLSGDCADKFPDSIVANQAT
jgi:hypothetical protein